MHAMGHGAWGMGPTTHVGGMLHRKTLGRMGREQCWEEEPTSSCRASVRLFDGDRSEGTAPPAAAEDCWMAALTAFLALPLSPLAAGSLPPLASAVMLLCCAPGDDLR